MQYSKTRQVLMEPKKIAQEVATSWRKSALQFKEVPLQLILDELSQAHKLEFSIIDQDLAKTRFTLTLPTEDMEATMDILSRTIGISIHKDSKKFIIEKIGNKTNNRLYPTTKRLSQIVNIKNDKIMKISLPDKKARTLFSSAFYVMLWSFCQKIWAESTKAEFATQPLEKALTEFEEYYHVFFNYQTELVKNKKVDFQFKPRENIESAIDRLLLKTGLKYDLISKKYIILYKNTQLGKKNVRKIRRKIKQIDRLELKGGVSLQRNQKGKIDRSITIMEAIVALPLEQTITGKVTGGDGLL